MNKLQERFFVEETARLLERPWHVGDDRESPDFVIDEGSCRFGLEVSELFSGPVGIKGALRKISEVRHQRMINRCYRAYDDRCQLPLQVQILGPVNNDTMKELLTFLLAQDFAQMQLGESVVFQSNGLFKAYVTRAYRHHWFRVDDRVGLVNTNPLPKITEAIAGKSRKLRKYRVNAGPDVRLLLVANRLFASGKLQLVKDAHIDTFGFRVVYFLSYPDTVTVFHERRT